jgi:hypothetical protein
MDRTITLRLSNTAARGEIARSTVVALAIKAGLPPLAADRAGAKVAAVAAASRANELTIVATLDGSRASFAIAGAGDAPLAALEALGATIADGRLTFTLERTPLRQV